MLRPLQRSGSHTGSARAAARGELTALPGPPKRLRWWVRGSPDPLLAELLADVDAVLAGPSSTPRPRMGRKRFYRVGPAGEPGLYVKLFHPPGGPLHWPARLRRAKAWREAEVGALAAQRGFDTALPLAVGEERRAGLLQRSLVVTRELAARDLRTRLQLDAPDAAQRRAWLISFGELQRRLHDAGIDQDDTSPNNFLLEESAAGLHWILIDFERCRVGGPLHWPRRWRLLAKLQRHELGVSRSERLRFLRAYLAAGTPPEPGAARQADTGAATRARPDGAARAGRERAARRAAWQQIEVELARVRAGAARRAAHGAFQPGRLIARDGQAWLVRGREAAALLRLSLPAREARATWILAHQLERLGLPALEPARLDRDGVAWVTPAPPAPLAPEERARRVARARRAFERCGRFLSEPEWLQSGERVLLRDPRAFELRLCASTSPKSRPRRG